jgi:adenylosuccinate lyase
VNLKILGGGMMMYKRQSMKRKNATNVYITTRVMKTYRSTKKTRKNVKKAVSEARGQTYAKLYQKLDTKDDENDVYKMTKFRERKTRYFNQFKFIKDETDKILVMGDEIKNRWREYFDKLFNE